MSAISGLGASNNSAANNTIAGNGNNAEGLSTMFLELLVAQISHQNPLDPMDGTQYVSQLAEFANVESLQSLKIDSGKNLELQASQQALQATGLIGQQVDVAADSIVLEQRGEIKGAINLGVDADAVELRLYNAEGKLMQQQSLGYSGVNKSSRMSWRCRCFSASVRRCSWLLYNKVKVAVGVGRWLMGKVPPFHVVYLKASAQHQAFQPLPVCLLLLGNTLGANIGYRVKHIKL